MRLITALSLLILSFSSLSMAESRPIKFVTLMDFKPFAWCESGVPMGIDVRIVEELLRRTQRQYTIECVPWKRALSSIKSGKADGLFSAYRTDERDEFATFLNYPTHMSIFSVFVRKGESFAFNKLEDLHDKKIGITAGYSINPEFDKAHKDNVLTVHESQTTVSGINMLLKRRIDTYINGKHAGLFTARNMGITNMIEPLERPVHPPRPAYLMISKSSTLADKEALIAQLNHSLKQMWSEGDIDAIIDHFTVSTVPVAIPNK